MKKLPPFPEVKPELLQEWDYEQNAGIDPNFISAGSLRKFWWKCRKDPTHKWSTTVNNRVRLGHRCPYCAKQVVDPKDSIANLFPTLMKEWHPTKNKDLDPTKISAGSQRRAWWICSKNHEHQWDSFIFNRTLDKRGCPFCSGFRVSKDNCLATRYPEIANEWHPTKNGDITPLAKRQKRHASSLI